MFLEPAHMAISIHTLRVEGDADARVRPDGQTAISIHTLRVEGDGDADLL